MRTEGEVGRRGGRCPRGDVGEQCEARGAESAEEMSGGCGRAGGKAGNMLECNIT